MGGKTKQSQRTKNNVRPSSSSRSAELLNSAVRLEGGLVTTSNGKVLPALFPTLAAVSLDQDINPEFVMCFKKLNKKDPITRAKALQELCELVNNGTADDVVAALPNWTHFYKILTTDTDRKVREMTQACHGAIVRVCGRRTAPQLKALLPSWLQAQYDEHAPAQTHAQTSLKNTFPDSKLPEVISFCKAEVMSHLLDNLIGNTEAIITKKIENPDERALQMSRIITSSLRGLEYFIPNLPAAQHDWLWAELSPLLDSPLYWKFSTHSSQQVRAAWCGATGRAAVRFGAAWGLRCGANTARALLLAPDCDAPHWACLLQFMHHVQDWHKYFDKRELLVKRILNVLEAGGWGDAKLLSTMLLPLLANLPQDMLTKEFYETFFNALYKGLDKKKILNSKSERQSWITSLSECLRYLSIQQNDFVVEVTTSVHRTWLEKVLATHHDLQTRNNLIKFSCTKMTSIVKYWLKQSKEEHGEKYDQLLRNFWQNTGSTVIAQIDKCSTDLDEIASLIDGHILLLQSLKTTFLQEAKKQHSIKFDDDRDVHNVEAEKAVVSEECDVSVVERYGHNLEQLVHEVCSTYVSVALGRQVARAVLTPLLTLLTQFDSRAMFASLARQFRVTSPYALYDSVLRGWLAGDTMRCKAVLDIIFIMMKYMSDEEQDAMFDSIEKLAPSVVVWCLSLVSAHPHVSSRACARWARSAAAAQAARTLAERAVTRGAGAELLLACLSPGPDDEPLLSEKGVSQVVQVVSSALTTARGGELEDTGALAARVVTSLAASATAAHSFTHTDEFATLVLRLFEVNMLVPRGDVAVSVDTWCEVRSSWQDGAAALPPRARDTFLSSVAELLQTQLDLHMGELNITKMEHIVSLCPHLFNRSVGDATELPAQLGELRALTSRVCDVREHVRVHTCAYRHECVTARMNILHADNDAVKNMIDTAADNDIKELTKSDLTTYLNKFLFRAIYLRTVLLHKIPSDDDESEDKTWCEALLGDEYFRTLLCEVIHDYMIVLSLHEGYTHWPHHDLLETAKSKMEPLLSDIISGMSESSRLSVDAALQSRTQRGYFSSVARRWCVLQRGGADQHVPPHQHVACSGNGFFHMLQAYVRFSSDVDIAYKTAYLVMLRSWNVANSDVDNPEFNEKLYKHEFDLDIIVNAYYKHEPTMLYEMDISDSPWTKVVSNVAVVDFLTLLVKHKGWEMAAHHWDFTTITLCSLLTSVHKSQHNSYCTKVSMLSRAVLDLYCAVRQFISNIRAEAERRQPQAHVMDLVKEWQDIFAPDLHNSLFSHVQYILESEQGRADCMSCPRGAALAALLAGTGEAAAPGALVPALLSAGTAGLARATHPAYKYLAYTLLHNLAKGLVYDDSQKLSLWSDDSEGDEEKDRPQFSLDLFHDSFTQLQDIVEAALNHVVPGEETCELVSMSDSHSMALGWLLLADVMAHMCRLARGDLAQFYIQIYRERSYAPALLTSALRLLPGAALLTSPRAALADMFLEVRPFTMYHACRGSDAARLACRAVLTSVCGAGCGPARGWWSAAAARTAQALERVVTHYVSPHAIKDQLQNLHQRASEIDDAEIRIAWSSSEVVCDYHVEESCVQLHVWLAKSHPLKPPRLAAPATGPPGNNTHWLALYLAYQNGTLLNALKMWTQAVNARVEKSPQCYICYCRLHPSTGRLPRVPCHQCKNKFHNLCLRKWFTTSNKSNCPLCRATF